MQDYGLMQARVRWRSHRGMLELDLLLLPFVDEQYALLSTEQQAVFVRLLECTDPELLSWLMGDGSPDDPDLNNMVQQIRAYHAS